MPERARPVSAWPLISFVGSGVVVLVLMVGPALWEASTAPPDVDVPLNGSELAAEVRQTVAAETDIDWPTLRVRIASWEVAGSSHLVGVEIYALLTSPLPSRYLVAAPCWAPGTAFTAGWIDQPGVEQEVRKSFAEAASMCP